MVPAPWLPGLLLALGLSCAAAPNLACSGGDDEWTATAVAEEAIVAIRDERRHRSPDIDDTTDPTQSGLVGTLITPVTSDKGSLPAKQASINANFAAFRKEIVDSERTHFGGYG